MLKNYKNLQFVLNNIKNSKYKAVFEYRKRKYMFGSNNYGEIPGLHNKADTDAWDVFAPGYDYQQLIIGKPYVIKKIIGYLKLDSGNHKIAILVYVHNFNKSKAINEIRKYCDTYISQNENGRWISLDTDFEL